MSKHTKDQRTSAGIIIGFTLFVVVFFLGLLFTWLTIGFIHPSMFS